MEGKYAYERFAHHHGVKIKHYRGNNMRYNETDFIDSCKQTNQKFNYCGVGAHHQNGLAEAKNKTLVYGARTLILYTKRRWHKVINVALWPFATLATAKSHNELSLDENCKSPLEKFTGIEDEITCSD